MPLTDTEMRRAIDRDEITIEGIEESCLQPCSYDVRVGKHVLRSGAGEEEDLAALGSMAIRNGEFVAFTTHEKISLSRRISGNLGPKAYFMKQGLILLCGHHIDPGFSGHLLMGLYNAAPRDVVVRFKEKICNVEFHRLNNEPEQRMRDFPELQTGEIPKDLDDYFAGMQPLSLHYMNEAVTSLALHTSDLAKGIKRLMAATCALIALALAVLVVAMVLALNG